MKKYFIITLCVLFASTLTQVKAQDDMQYLFGGGEDGTAIGGFGGIINEFSGFDKDFAFSMGGGIALLIDHKFYIGGYGLGVTTRHIRNYQGVTSSGYLLNKSEDLYTRFGHGGFWLGYIHNPQKAIHWGVNAKLGWGTVSMTDKTYKDYYEGWTNVMYDNVFVITPEVNMGMNLLKWMRLNVGVGYRVVTGVNETYKVTDPQLGIVEKEYFDKNAFNSVTGNITLVFGWL